MLDDNTSTSQPSINGPGIDEDSCRGIVQKIEHISLKTGSSIDCSCKDLEQFIHCDNNEFQPRKRIGHQLLKND